MATNKFEKVSEGSGTDKLEGGKNGGSGEDKSLNEARSNVGEEIANVTQSADGAQGVSGNKNSGESGKKTQADEDWNILGPNYSEEQTPEQQHRARCKYLFDKLIPARKKLNIDDKFLERFFGSLDQNTVSKWFNEYSSTFNEGQKRKIQHAFILQLESFELSDDTRQRVATERRQMAEQQRGSLHGNQAGPRGTSRRQQEGGQRNFGELLKKFRGSLVPVYDRAKSTLSSVYDRAMLAMKENRKRAIATVVGLSALSALTLHSIRQYFSSDNSPQARRTTTEAEGTPPLSKLIGQEIDFGGGFVVQIVSNTEIAVLSPAPVIVFVFQHTISSQLTRVVPQGFVRTDDRRYMYFLEDENALFVDAIQVSTLKDSVIKSKILPFNSFRATDSGHSASK